MTPLAVDASKADWRDYFRRQLAQLSPADQSVASAQIRHRLEARAEWQRAGSVLFFAPIADEPDLLPLLGPAFSSGKVIAFPRRSATSDTYEAARIADAVHDLVPGRFGIPEPRRQCPEFALNELDFALVPGIGFALNGGRLGRGRGYFDRLLAAVPGFKCGVAFDCQVVPELPSEPHDVCLDCILTPTRWHPTASRARS